VTANCGVTNLRITYWGRWMDDGRIVFLLIMAKLHVCRESECSCLTFVYSYVDVYNIHTQSKTDVSVLRHCNTVDLT
jgi:hypothetical protein